MSAQIRPLQGHLRPMSPTDLDAVMAIERRAYPYPWTRGIFRDCLHVGYCCWVYEEDHHIQGYAVMSIGAGEAHVLNLCVRPEAQRRGLGRHLLNHLIEVACEHKAEVLLLEVRPSNRPAVRLYRRTGFVQVGLRRGYYPDDGGREDALIMALHL